MSADRKGRSVLQAGELVECRQAPEPGEHSRSCHLGTHSTSIYDVTNSVLVTEEAKGNER